MTKGTFWNPIEPNEEFTGWLVLKRGSPRLKFRSLEDDPRHALLFGQSAVIQGRMKDGELVTLLHATPDRNFLLHDPADSGRKRGHHQNYDYAFFGAHVADPGAALFRQSTISFVGLGEWSRHPEVMRVSEEVPPTFAAATITNLYGTGLPVQVSIENAAVVERDDEGRQAFRRFLGNDARIVFTFDEPQTVAMHTRLAFDLRALLTFSYQQNAQIDEQTISIAPGSDEIRYSYRRDVRKDQVRLHKSQMVITPDALAPELLFPKWWAALSELYPVPQILAGRYYTRQAFIEGHVLSAVASAEKFYTLLDLPQERMDKTFFRARRKEHLALEEARQDDSPEQALFDAILQEGLQNRQTFDAKLRALVLGAGPETVAAASIDAELWVKKVKQVRNKLAHEGSHVNERGYDDASDWLGRVDNSTRVILTLIVRSWLGAPALDLPAVRRIFRGRGVQLEPGEDTA